MIAPLKSRAGGVLLTRFFSTNRGCLLRMLSTSFALYLQASEGVPKAELAKG